MNKKHPIEVIQDCLFDLEDTEFQELQIDDYEDWKRGQDYKINKLKEFLKSYHCCAFCKNAGLHEDCPDRKFYNQYQDFNETNCDYFEHF